MASPANIVKAVLRGFVRAHKTLPIEFAPIRATGVPAVLLGAGAIVVAAGIANALGRNAERLPETLSEARRLAEAMRPAHGHLNA